MRSVRGMLIQLGDPDVPITLPAHFPSPAIRIARRHKFARTEEGVPIRSRAAIHALGARRRADRPRNRSTAAGNVRTKAPIAPPAANTSCGRFPRLITWYLAPANWIRNRRAIPPTKRPSRPPLQHPPHPNSGPTGPTHCPGFNHQRADPCYGETLVKSSSRRFEDWEHGRRMKRLLRERRRSATGP